MNLEITFVKKGVLPKGMEAQYIKNDTPITVELIPLQIQEGISELVSDYLEYSDHRNRIRTKPYLYIKNYPNEEVENIQIESDGINSSSYTILDYDTLNISEKGKIDNLVKGLISDSL